MDDTTITEQDARSFAEKLDAFSQTLTPGERAILTAVEQQLAGLVADDDDVSGYVMSLDQIAGVRQAELTAEANQLQTRSEPAPEPSSADRRRFWEHVSLSLSRLAGPVWPTQRATG